MSKALVFAALHLPRPLDPAAAREVLARLASEPATPIVLEVRADAAGVRHLIGARASDLGRLRRLFGDLLPDSALVVAKRGAPVQRPEMTAAARLRLTPAGMPLRSDMAEATTRALLSALAVRLTGVEAMAVQIVLGPRRAPRLVSSRTPDPHLSWWHLLTKGIRPADGEVRSRLKERLGQTGLAATIRLGAAGGTPQRRRRFVMSLLGALTTAQGPDVRLELVREPAQRLNEARLPWRWPLSLGISELVGLLGWPLGDGELPGLPPLHPKPLRASANVHTGPRVFAQSAAPGDERQLGISAQDQTFHAIAYGPSGSGKTNALLHLILADIDAGRPVVVLDPKRQLIDDVLARLPEHRVPDVVELNAADASPVGFNPLDVAGRDPDVVVDGILSVFQAVFADGWGPRTADIFSAGLRTLARSSTGASSTEGRQEHRHRRGSRGQEDAQQIEPATLVDLPRLLTDPAFRRSRVGRVQQDIALAGFWAWYEGQSPGAQAAAIAPPLNKLRQFLLRPALIRMLDQRGSRSGGTSGAASSHPDGDRGAAFRLRDVFKDNKVVLVPLNEGLIGPGTASLLGSLVIAEVWQATQERAGHTSTGTGGSTTTSRTARAGNAPGARNPTSTVLRPGVVYVDEAPRFLNLPVSLADALAVSRSLGVGWFLAAQFREQFPAALRSAVDINARSKVQFATEYGEAQAAAKLAPGLTAEDFVALPRFHAYANLVAQGAPSGWALVETLPPPPAVHDPEAMRGRVRANHAPPPTTETQSDDPTSDEPNQSEDQASAPPQEEPIGRKRRRSARGGAR